MGQYAERSHQKKNELRFRNQIDKMADKATPSGEWKHGLCDCFNPVDAYCCYSLYCNPCDLYDQSEHMEPGSGLFSLICGFVCPIIPLIMNRARSARGMASRVMDVVIVAQFVAVPRVLLYRSVSRWLHLGVSSRICSRNKQHHTVWC